MPPIRSHMPLGDITNESDATSPVKSIKKARTLWVWEHGMEIRGYYGNSWRCDHCPHPVAKAYSIASTTHAIKHLKDAHGIAEVERSSTNQTKIPMKPQIDSKVLRKLITEWIVDRQHAFNEVEAESFRKI